MSKTRFAVGVIGFIVLVVLGAWQLTLQHSWQLGGHRVHLYIPKDSASFDGPAWFTNDSVLTAQFDVSSIYKLSSGLSSPLFNISDVGATPHSRLYGDRVYAFVHQQIPSPDGKWLLIHTTHQTPYYMAWVAVELNGPRRIERRDPKTEPITMVVWSPDSRSWNMLENALFGGRQMTLNQFSIDNPGTVDIPVPQHRYRYASGLIYPASGHLTIVAKRAFDNAWVRYDAATKAETVLKTTSPQSWPVVSPSGKQVAWCVQKVTAYRPRSYLEMVKSWFARPIMLMGNELLVTDINGGHEQYVTDDQSLSLAIKPNFAMSFSNTLRWSPDESKLGLNAATGFVTIDLK